MRRLIVLCSIAVALGLGTFAAFGYLRGDENDAATRAEQRADTLAMERPNARALGLWLNFRAEQAKAGSTVLSLPDWPVLAAWAALFSLCSAALVLRVRERIAEEANKR
jgi:hypothetical protein